VARPPSPVIASRNHEIYSLFQRGSSIMELAGQFNLSPQRIGQVIASQNPEAEEDYDRGLYRGYLWRLFEEIRDLYRNPGYKMSPTGRPAVDPDDEPALDTNVRLQAGELELKILESLRKMDARDKAAQQNIKHTHEFYEQQKDESLSALAAKKAADDARIRELEARVALQGPVIPGEVVRELGSAQQRGEE
jgi:hypothetical protein